MIVLSLVPIFRVLSINREKLDCNEDIYIGAKQISEYLIGSYFVSLDDSYTYISIDDKETTLYYSENNLIKKPGYEVLLTNVENVSFEIVDCFLYMNVYREDQSYRFLIAYIHEKENQYE